MQEELFGQEIANNDGVVFVLLANRFESTVTDFDFRFIEQLRKYVRRFATFHCCQRSKGMPAVVFCRLGRCDEF